MGDIKIPYVVVAQDIDYVKINDGERKFAIVDPLINLEVDKLPSKLKTRVAFSTVGMNYGEKYTAVFFLFDPVGREIINKEQTIMCNDFDSKPVVTTFVQNAEFDIFEAGEYVFKVGIKDQVLADYTLYISEGVF